MSKLPARMMTAAKVIAMHTDRFVNGSRYEMVLSMWRSVLITYEHNVDAEDLRRPPTAFASMTGE